MPSFLILDCRIPDLYPLRTLRFDMPGTGVWKNRTQKGKRIVNSHVWSWVRKEVMGV
jgi:hypothetical protein